MVNNLPTQQLQPNPFQPRGKIRNEEISELAQSIKTYGILEPIVVAHTPAGYQIIAGERRWRAAQLVGLKEVPVYVKETTPKGMLEMALVENVQREDLNSLERAQAFRQLMRNFNYSNSQLAQKVGKSPSYISNTLKLLSLPDAVTDGLIAGQISEGHARAMSGLENEADMVQVYKIILKENGSVRRAEELARRYKDKQLKSPSSSAQKSLPKISDSELESWQNKFNSFFHARSKLKLTRSHRQTKLTITLKGSPEETQEDLEKIIQIAEAE